MRNSVLADIRRHEPGFAPAVIFDVGANVGQSALEFRQLFPKARLYCFEPVAATVEALRAALGEDPLTSVHRCAVGNGEGVIRVTARRTSSGNRVLAPGDRQDNSEEVPLLRGEGFCREQGVERVDFLKIDTEGHDLEVLRGFEPMLREGRVDYVQAEVALSRANRLHAPLEAVMGFMAGLGYGFYGLYGASRNDHMGKKVWRGLFYGNAAFVRES